MPSGYAAMLDLCDAVRGVGGVASMLGPSWVFHEPISWSTAVAMQAIPRARAAYHPFLESHAHGDHALLEVHTTFPSIGAGGANWVQDVRQALASWELSHPGYKAELSGGATEDTDMRNHILHSMWSYL